MADTMKAIVIYEPGGPEKLICTEVPKPVVKPGWSLVRVKGFGINHSEIFTRQGLSPSVAFPRIPGIECVGILEESTDPARLQEGSRVISIMGEMGRAFDGSYAEYVLLPNEQICPVESGLPWEVLAAVPETYYTAFGSLKNLRPEREDRILVRGGTSGVGIAFLRLIKGRNPGQFVAGSTRNPGKAEVMKEAGYDAVIEERDGILQTEERYDRLLELIGPATLRDSCAHVREGGIVCSAGQLGGQWDMAGFEPITDLPPNGYLTSFYSGNVDPMRLQELLAEIETENIDAAPEAVYSLPEVPAAHARLESSRGYGKLVVLV